MSTANSNGEQGSKPSLGVRIVRIIILVCCAMALAAGIFTWIRSAFLSSTCTTEIDTTRTGQAHSASQVVTHVRCAQAASHLESASTVSFVILAILLVSWGLLGRMTTGFEVAGQVFGSPFKWKYKPQSAASNFAEDAEDELDTFQLPSSGGDGQ